MAFDFMRNIKINKIRDTYYTVTATTKRFGINQVMYEGISEEECKKYISRERFITLPCRNKDSYISEWIIKYDYNGHYFIAYKKRRKPKTTSPFTRVKLEQVESLLKDYKEGFTLL